MLTRTLEWIREWRIELIPYRPLRLARWFVAAALLIVVALLPVTAQAQLMGHNLTGDFGLRSGSQAPAGRYVGFFLPVYVADSLKGPAGGKIDSQGNLKLVAIAPFVWFVTETKILGGNYGALIVPSFANTALEFPRLDVDDSQFGFADLYVVPFQLGWHRAGRRRQHRPGHVVA